MSIRFGFRFDEGYLAACDEFDVPAPLWLRELAEAMAKPEYAPEMLVGQIRGKSPHDLMKVLPKETSFKAKVSRSYAQLNEVACGCGSDSPPSSETQT